MLIVEIDQNQLRRNSLGTLRRNIQMASKAGAYGWTISLSDKMKILRKDIRPRPPSLRTKFLKWGSMNIDQQINFLNSYIDELTKCSLFPSCTGYYGAYELTKAGNIHCHLIICTTTIRFDVINLRRLTSQHKICQSLHYGRNEIKLNFIHELEDTSEWIEYLLKDYVLFGRYISLHITPEGEA